MVYSAAARGVVEAPRRWPSSPLSRCSNEGGLKGFSIPRELWYDDASRGIVEDEATHELREVLGHKGGRFSDWMPAFTGPGACLSAGSTSATTPGSTRCATTPGRLDTPPPPTFSPPPSTDCSETAPFDASDESPAHFQASRIPGNPQDKELWRQSRKVFVGGIPQTIDVNGFSQLFNQIGKVEKAWLQWQHDSDGRAMQKHRGFGFVVFRNATTIDHLIGQEMSKHIWFGDSLKLEVKRAFGKSEYVSTPHSDYPKCPGTPQLEYPKGPGTPHSDYHKGKNLKQRLHGSQCSSPSSQTWQSNSSPAPSTSWMSHPWLYSNLPGVPPFPCMESKAPEPSQSRGASMTTSPSPIVSQRARSHSEHMTNDPTWICGFVGQQPRDRQELEQMLRAATPTHYEY